VNTVNQASIRLLVNQGAIPAPDRRGDLAGATGVIGLLEDVNLIFGAALDSMSAALPGFLVVVCGAENLLWTATRNDENRARSSG
jgi:hypothetical protein